MIEQLLSASRAFTASVSNPRADYRGVSSKQLSELSELAYMLAFWSGYELNQRGESTELIMRMDRNSLWQAATGLPMPTAPETVPDCLEWLLEPAGDVFETLQAAKPSRARLDDRSLKTLEQRLAGALGLVRRELRKRGLTAPVASLVTND